MRLCVWCCFSHCAACKRPDIGARQRGFPSSGERDTTEFGNWKLVSLAVFTSLHSARQKRVTEYKLWGRTTRWSCGGICRFTESLSHPLFFSFFNFDPEGRKGREILQRLRNKRETTISLESDTEKKLCQLRSGQPFALGGVPLSEIASGGGRFESERGGPGYATNPLLSV